MFRAVSAEKLSWLHSLLSVFGIEFCRQLNTHSYTLGKKISIDRRDPGSGSQSQKYWILVDDALVV